MKLQAKTKTATFGLEVVEVVLRGRISKRRVVHGVTVIKNDQIPACISPP